MMLEETAADPPSAPPRRLSDVLRDLDAGLGDRISVGDLIEGLTDRSFAPLMVLFAIPNVILYIPGSSAITALPLMLLSLQLLAGRRGVWLPGAIGRRSIDRALFSRIVRASLPWVERIERLARPRFWPRPHAAADRFMGLLTLLMSVLIFLPIPFANGIPALAVVALGLAISERDGLWLGAGIVIAVAAVAFVGALVGGGLFAAAQILG